VGCISALFMPSRGFSLSVQVITFDHSSLYERVATMILHRTEIDELVRDSVATRYLSHMV
jgi:hypothetical protein